MMGSLVRQYVKIRLVLAIALLCLVVWLLNDGRQQKRVATGSRAVSSQAGIPAAPPPERAADKVTSEEESDLTPWLFEEGGVPIEFVVRVLDSHGNAARDAMVRIYRSGAPAGMATTDAAGEARFTGRRRDEFAAEARSDREIGSGRISLSVTDKLEIRMEPTLPFGGTVLDLDGRPIAGAEVMVLLAGPTAEPFLGMTDSEGRVPVPARETDLHPYYQVSARGFGPAFGEFEKETLLRAGFEIRLERLATVTGRFVDEDGQGVPEVDVLVPETMQKTLSGPDGRFELAGIPSATGTLVASPPRRGRVVLRNVRPGILGDIVLGPGLTISGTVVSPDGSPRSGLRVWVLCETTGLYAGDAQSENDGSFVVKGLSEGLYTVIAFWTRSQGVAAGADNLRLVVRLSPTLTVELASAENEEPAYVLRLEVSASLHGTTRTWSRAFQDPRKRRVHNATLTFDAPGEYDVTVKTPGCPDQSFSVTLAPEEWEKVTVRLPRVE